MSEAAIEQVRSFNRVVVQSVGALEDRYLSRRLPLGEARVFWEIGRVGCGVRGVGARVRFDAGFDPARSISAAAHELRPPEGLFVVARLHGEPVGCGALKFHGGAPAELKRMWVAEPARGLGLGRRLFAELERLAAENGVRA